jgi:hypothetical protein
MGGDSRITGTEPESEGAADATATATVNIAPKIDDGNQQYWSRQRILIAKGDLTFEVTVAGEKRIPIGNMEAFEDALGRLLKKQRREILKLAETLAETTLTLTVEKHSWTKSIG